MGFQYEPELRRKFFSYFYGVGIDIKALHYRSIRIFCSEILVSFLLYYTLL